MFHSGNTLKQIPFSFVMCNFGGGKHAALLQIIFDIFVESKKKQDGVKPTSVLLRVVPLLYFHLRSS